MEFSISSLVIKTSTYLSNIVRLIRCHFLKVVILLVIFFSGNIYSQVFVGDSATIFISKNSDIYIDKKSNINPSYKMMSLTEVDQFIKENKHLPGVTSINDLGINKDGQKEFEIGKLSTQTLEKVEELYLHTIEQQKQIDNQKVEIDELKSMIKQQQDQINKLLIK